MVFKTILSAAYIVSHNMPLGFQLNPGDIPASPQAHKFYGEPGEIRTPVSGLDCQVLLQTPFLPQFSFSGAA